MTIIYAAATVPVNSPGVSPVITMKQLWAGLELKARYVSSFKSFHVHYDALVYQVPSRAMLSHFSKPQLFLPVIDTCDVLEDDGQTVLREIKFKEGN
jgi:hypothetical protein